MSLPILLDQSKKTLTRAAAERAYAEARPRHAAFAPYETIGALLSAVERGSPISVDARDAVFAAVVTELQSSRDPLWSSLLFAMFTPMLVRLRVRLRRPGNDEIDQSVVLAFLETARTLRFRTYVARNLFLLTRARIFAERKRDRRGPDVFEFDEETHPCDPFRVEAHQRAVAAEVVRIIEAEGGEELRDVLLATCGDDSSIKDLVDRAHADCDDRTRARVAKRLRRARSDAFAKVRARAERRGRWVTTAA